MSPRFGLRHPVVRAAMRGGTWTPLDLAPDIWLDASDPATITDVSGAVSQWRDKSGNLHHFDQSTPGNRPVTGSRTQNGLNVIDFTRASAHFLNAGNILNLGTLSWSSVSVFKFDDTLGSAPFGKNIAGVTDGRYGALRTSGSLQAIYDPDVAGTGIISVSDSSLDCRQITTLLDRAGAASTHKLRRDGAANVKSFTDPGTSWSTSAPWRVGRYGTSTSFDMDGFIAEIIFVRRTLTATEVEAAEAYLQAKWGTP